MTHALHQVDTAQEGLLLEAELFASRDPGVLVWSARQNSIVCPRALLRTFNFDAEPAFDGWPVTSRATGGGAVPQGAGVLNFAMAYDVPARATIKDTYSCLTTTLKEGLSGLGLELQTGPTTNSFCNGTWNLSVNGQKIVGTAQRWKPKPCGGARVLAHALILVDGDIETAAGVIAALHRHFGLPPVDAAAHQTLAGLCNGSGVDIRLLAQRLIHAGAAMLGEQERMHAAA